uniref:Uncharacterized protein n=1 Tax=Arundo donax TaxID=35708 RepID=A0A0A9A2C0_ARUDO
MYLLRFDKSEIVEYFEALGYVFKICSTEALKFHFLNLSDSV